MNSVYLAQITDFVKANDATLVLNYSNKSWDCLVTWDTHKAFGSATDFTRALRIAWREIQHVGDTESGNYTA